ncbi:copper resistance protein CopC [Salinibacterium sp. ZJ450]|uniref:copper resistance CopC family protein n=1 Tax=Salinibacterium sp. ZJ450 TaxID=2708338 RepID=UPI0014241659|nr:copper resistance protein CopC [Salinibacterium sp. ZJ450]
MTTTVIRACAALGAAALLTLGAPLAASAHSSATPTPADGATISELPAEFAVTASEPFFTGAGDAAFGLLVQNAAGQYFGDGCFTIADATLSTPAALGEAGSYTMTWQFVSGDSHPTEGSSSFTWAPPAGFEPETGSATAPTCEPEPTPTEDSTAGAAPSSAPSTAPDASENSSDTSETEAAANPTPWIIGIAAVLIVGGIAYGVARRRGEKSETATQNDDSTTPTK